jgi:hypothetical protein
VEECLAFSTANSSSIYGSAVLKVVVQKRSCMILTWHWRYYICAPGASREDDGVVVSICSKADGLAFCVFLDGQSFNEIARAEMPYGLTYGFHGNWFPTQGAPNREALEAL